MDRGIKVIRWASVFCALAALSPAHARGEGVTVIEHDGSVYAQSAAAKQMVAKRFFEANSDSYDFLVVFPTFPTDFGDAEDGEKALGHCSYVRNDVRGIGHIIIDQGEAYGSASRLNAYVDVASLVPGTLDSTLDGALGIIAHEVAHRWSGRVSFRDRDSGIIRRDLLGRDEAHWNFFLDSQASTLYGSEWRESSPGTFVSVASRKRYSALDLYLMGFLPASEVPALTLLHPGQSSSWSATDIPPPDGTQIAATSESISIQDVIAAEGARAPSSTQAQREFRAAFILLTAPGAQPSSAQLEFVENVRRAWTKEFFFLTRGQAVMETELVNGPSGPFAADSDVRKGFDYLFSRQESDGRWSDGIESSARDTQAALNSIRLLPGDSRSGPAIQSAVTYLQGSTVIDADSKARQVLGLLAANHAGLFEALSPAGLVSGWDESVIDSVLVATARAATGASAEEQRAVSQWLAQQQNVDGGWPYVAGGPSRIEPTALVLGLLSGISDGMGFDAEILKGAAYLRARRFPQGLFGDDLPTVSATALVLKALHAAEMLDASDAHSASAAILSAQGEDGSWSQSAHQTALALEALRLVKTSNLALDPNGVVLSSNRAIDGEVIVASLRVRNVGFVASMPTEVGVFDGSGADLGAVVAIPALEPGRHFDVSLKIDTGGHGPSSAVYFVLDPAGALDETRRDDNFLTAPLVIDPPPARVDLVVANASVSCLPGALERLPAGVVVTAQVNNLGLTDAGTATVNLYAAGLFVGTANVALPARSSATVSIPGTIIAAEGDYVPLTITIDAENAIEESDETNNSASGRVDVVPVVDLAIQALVVPQAVEQGSLVPITFELVNRGTKETAHAQVEVRLLTGTGDFVATLANRPATVLGGEVIHQVVEWRAGLAGELMIQVRVINSDEAFPEDNSANVAFSVAPASRANLVVRAGDFVVDPSPALEGAEATLRARVTNSSTVSSVGFSVDFYDGDPAKGGALLSRQEVASLAGGAQTDLSVSLGLLGEEHRTYVAVVDPEGSVEEFDEEDNLTVRTVAPLHLPDAALLASDIVLSERFPRENSQVAVTISVRNLGEQALEPAFVELFLGAPEAGGAVVGTRRLEAVEGLQQVDATIAWSTAGLSGKQRLVAVVNRSRTVGEKNYENNRAEVELFVQDGAFAASSRYLSPNGDGVKDSVEFSYRLSASAAVDLAVTDSRGNRVKTLNGADAEVGVLEWDGRDERGRVVGDGEYQVTLMATGSLASLGSTVVIVDTNRTQLHQLVGTDLIRTHQLNSVLEPSHGTNVREIHAAAESDAVYFFSATTADYESVPYGVYSQPIGGGAPLLVSPVLDEGLSTSLGFAVSLAGDKVAFVDYENGLSLKLLSIPAQTIATLATDQDDSWNTDYEPKFNPGGDAMAVVSRDWNAWLDRVEIFATDGSSRKALLSEQAFAIKEFEFSPDAAWLSVLRWDGMLVLVSVESGKVVPLLPAGESSHLPFQHAWLGRDEILVTRDVYGSVLAVNAVTGEVREFLGEALSVVAPTVSADAVAFARANSSSGEGGMKLGRTDGQGVVISAPPGAKPLLLDEVDPDYLQWAGGGASLVADYRAYYSLANLTNHFIAVRRSGENAIVFQGTVADLHLDRFELKVRRLLAEGEWTVVRSTQQVMDGIIARWLPPEPGIYEAVLEAWDLAGNSRTSRTKFAWSDRATIAALQVEPEFVSPNGDGIQDAAVVRYAVTAPVSVEFSVRDSAGVVVKVISKSHLKAGDYSFEWDCFASNGIRVPDGDYRLEVEGNTRDLVVDTAPPAAMLGFGRPLSSGETQVFEVREMARILDCNASPGNEIFCQTQVEYYAHGLDWHVDDEHLVSWKVSTSGLEQGNSLVAEGEDAGPFHRVMPMSAGHGVAYSLSAMDLAGNRSSIEDARPAELSILSHVGDVVGLVGEVGLLTASGLVFPRLDLVEPVTEVDGRAQVSFPTDGLGNSVQVAFWFEHTISRPIVGGRLKYRKPNSGDFVDAHAELVGGSLIVWDARALPVGDYEVLAGLVDDQGRVFESRVFLGLAPIPEGQSCLSFDRDAGPVLLVPGARTRQATLEFRQAVDGRVEAAVPLVDGRAVLSGSLPGCRFWLAETGVFDGIPYSEDRGYADVCRIAVAAVRVASREVEIEFDSLAPERVAFVDVYFDAELRGSVPVEQGRRLIRVPLLPEDECGGARELRLVGRTAGGLLLDSKAPSPQGLGCDVQPEGFSLPCGELLVGRPTRDGHSLGCMPNEPTYSARIDFSGSHPLLDLRVAARSLARGLDYEAGVTGSSNGGLWATVETNSLPEGKYVFVAKAVTATGDELEVTSPPAFPVIVDRKPPEVFLSSPVNASICPVPASLPDGRTGNRLEITGLVADDNLELVSALMRRVGDTGFTEHVLVGPLDPPRYTAIDGVVGTLDVGSLSSADYEIVLNVRDASGGAVCAPVETFHLSRNVAVSGLIASVSVFAPDGDGFFDSTSIAFDTDDQAQARLSLYSGATLVGSILERAVNQGRTELAWDGLLASGETVPDGSYTLKVEPSNGCGAGTGASIAVELDTQPPMVRIDGPLSGASGEPLITVRGEATDRHFLSYDLSIGAGLAPTAYTPVFSSTVPTVGLLGVVATNALTPGDYVLRLRARDTLGHESETLASFQVLATSLIGSIAVVPSLISPDGDGNLETARVEASLLAPCTASIQLVDASGQLVRVLREAGPVSAGSLVVEIDAFSLAGLADGEWTVRVTAELGTDSEHARAPLVIDTTVPALEVTEPLAGAVVAGEVLVSGTVGDANLADWSVKLVGPEGEKTLTSDVSSRSGLLGSAGGLGDGAYELHLQASDRAGHLVEQRVSFVSDSTAPVIAFLQPLAGSWLSGAGGPVPVRASLREENLEELRLEVQGSQGTRRPIASIASIGAGDLVADWNVAAETDGPATLFLAAEDVAGNTTTIEIAVRIDNTPPLAAMAAPADYLRAPADCVGTASDANLKSWTLSFAPGSGSASDSFIQMASGSTSVISGRLGTLVTLPRDGVHTLRLEVIDEAGNSTRLTEEIVVDTVAPSAPVLIATVSRPDDARLEWSAASESDFAGYRLWRAHADGQLASVSEALVPTNSFEDLDLADGSYRYAVTALDHAGNESPKSNVVTLSIDTLPPAVSIARPANGAVLSQSAQVIGTAHSVDDFKELRLSVGDGASPGAWSLVSRATVPVRNAVLGEVSLSGVANGAQATIRLEAEDSSGNVAEARITVQVDNVPPDAPVLLSVAPSGTSIAATWQASTASDLAGYLLFRNGALANAPVGSSFADWTPYVLPSNELDYVDAALPDGSFEYELRAIDLAGNLSEASNALAATLDNRAPSAVVISPPPLARLNGTVTVGAQVEDEDVASVQFEARASSSETFAPVGAPRSSFPYVAALDTTAFASSTIEVRAVATDLSGHVDPAPKSVFYLLRPNLSAPVVSSLVDGNSVSLAWSGAEPQSSVVGFDVMRDGSSALPAPARPNGTASASSTAAGTPASGYDSSSATSWRSGLGMPQSWQLQLDAPAMLSSMNVQTRAGVEAELDVEVGGLWLPVGARTASDYSGLLSFALPHPMHCSTVRVRFVSSSTNYASIYEASLGQQALLLGSSFSETGLASGEHHYSVVAFTAAGATTSGEARALVYAPVLDAPSAAVAGSSIELVGRDTPPGALVSVHSLGSVVATVSSDSEGGFRVSVPLTVGENEFFAQAVDANGNRSLPSGSVRVVHAPAPDLQLVLAVDSVLGSKVSLSFTVAGDTSSLAGFTLLRTGLGASKELILDAGSRVAVDSLVPNGLWSYRIAPFNSAGFHGEWSNPVEVSLNVGSLDAPQNVAVGAPASGAVLDVTWDFDSASQIGGFVVERSLDAQAGFVSAGSVVERRFSDRAVTNGTTYFYRVAALDLAGNLGAYSLVATGVPRDTQPPVPPRIVQPTVAGSPVTLQASSTSVSGFAEYGSDVHLYANGALAGTTRVEAYAVSSKPISTAYPIQYGSFDVSEDSSVIAYSFTHPSTSAKCLAVEGGSLSDTAMFCLPSVFVSGRISISPDKNLVAYEGLSFADYRTYLYVADLQAHMASRLTAISGGERFPTWSPDSSRLAYAATRQYASVLASCSLSTREEQVLARFEGAELASPVWLDQASVAVVANYCDTPSRIVRVDTATSGIVDLAASLWFADGLALSADGTLLAAVGVEAEGARLMLVDTASGSLAFPVSDGAPRSSPVFSPDGSQLAVLANGKLELHELDAGTRTLLGVVAVDRLVWPSTGLVGISSSEAGHLAWGGSFVFPRVPLTSGDNYFVTLAEDSSGNRSEPSESILVISDTSGLADLAVAAVVQPAMPMVGEDAEAIVTVHNLGAQSVDDPELALSVLGSDGSIRTAPLVKLGWIGPGQSATAAVSLDLLGLEGNQRLKAVVDPAGLVPDADRRNNEVIRPFRIVADLNPAISISASPGSVHSSGLFAATATLLNPGPALSATVAISLESADGAAVLSAAPELFDPLPSMAERVVVRELAVGNAFAGSYRVVGRVMVGGAVVSEATAPVVILPDRTVALSLRPQQAQFEAGAPIGVELRLDNDSPNVLLSGAVCELKLRNADGDALILRTRQIPSLARGATYSEVVLFEPGLSPGNYVVSAEALLDGAVLANASSAVEVAGSSPLAGAIRLADVTGDPPRLRSGVPLSVETSVRNEGAVAAEQVTARISLFDAQSATNVADAELAVGSLSAGVVWTSNTVLPTHSLVPQLYGLVLTASYPGGTEQILATGRLQIIDGAAPLLSLVDLTDGMFVPGTISPTVAAEDVVDGVQTVSVRIDSGEPRSLSLISGSPLDGMWAAGLKLGADGVHRLEFSAVDRAGNDGAAFPDSFNPVAITVTSDSVPPVVAILGIENGAVIASGAAATIEAADDNLASLRATLDGAPYLSGQPIEGDGKHLLVAVARDRAGNESFARVDFEVDQSAPRISIGGVSDGAFVKEAVTPTVQAFDTNLAGIEVLLDSNAFIPGTVVSDEGKHILVVEAWDSAGHQSAAQVAFVIDTSPPQIQVEGFVEGALVADTITPRFSATDLNLAGVSGLLDGLPFATGTEVAFDGSHTLVVTAYDRAGNSARAEGHFSIDRTAPVVVFGGFVDGWHYLGDVLPSFEVLEPHPAGVPVAALDGNAFVPGSVVGAEGEHLFVVEATDLLGNHASVTGMFTIDLTPPRIEVSGVVEDGLYSEAARPEYTASDANLDSVVATLDGEIFESGASVFAEGSHTLLVEARDLAGNVATQSVEFVVVGDGPGIVHTPVPSPQSQGTAVGLEARTTEGVVALTLFYRTQGTGAFLSASMTSVAGDHSWSTSIPAAEVNVPGVEYYLEARDGDGNTALHPEYAPTELHHFSVVGPDGDAPIIDHTPVAEGRAAGQPVEVRAAVADPSGISSVAVLYRLQGSSEFTRLPMELGEAGEYLAQIPASDVLLPGLEYYLEAIDASASANMAVEPSEAPDELHAFSVIAADETPPLIDHTPIGDGQPEGLSVAVGAIVTDASGVSAVSLFARVAGSSSFEQFPMAEIGTGAWNAEIPARLVGIPGVEYYLLAVDGSPAANSSTSPEQGAASPHSFSVSAQDAAGPSISHQPIEGPVPAGVAVPVSALVSDSSGVDGVRLYFRPKGEDAFRSAMLESGDGRIFNGLIPADVVLEAGVDYYLEATDLSPRRNLSYDPAGAPGSVHDFAVEKPADGVAPQSCSCATAEGTLLSVVAAFVCASALIPRRRRRRVDRAQ